MTGIPTSFACPIGLRHSYVPAVNTLSTPLRCQKVPNLRACADLFLPLVDRDDSLHLHVAHSNEELLHLREQPELQPSHSLASIQLAQDVRRQRSHRDVPNRLSDQDPPCLRNMDRSHPQLVALRSTLPLAHFAKVPISGRDVLLGPTILFLPHDCKPGGTLLRRQR